MTVPPRRRSSGMIVRSGVHQPLEDAANELLKQALAPITKHSEKSDVLTPWKEQSRRSREVYVPSGTPDSTLRQGNFHRVYNPSAPHLNSVDLHSPSAPRIRKDGSSSPSWRSGKDWDSE